MRPAAPLTSDERDRALRRVRVVAWTAGIGAAALTGGLSVAAAHAFKGHGSTSAPTARATATPAPAATPGVHVPPAQHVPAIAGSPDALAPPQQAPTAVPAAPVPAPPPPVSGGS